MVISILQHMLCFLAIFVISEYKC